jgi:predicted transcriptional regulator
MGRSKRETLAQDKRREVVADLYLKGWSQMAIAAHLGLSQATISNDLKAIQAQWRESSVRDFDSARERELRKLDRVERESWAAWERSQKPTQSAVMSTDGSEQRTQKTVKEQCGDPRFLEQIVRCIASRRALLGIDAPTKFAPVSPDGEEAYHAHVMSTLMRLAEAVKDNPVVIDAQYITRHIERAAEEQAKSNTACKPC